MSAAEARRRNAEAVLDARDVAGEAQMWERQRRVHERATGTIRMADTRASALWRQPDWETAWVNYDPPPNRRIPRRPLLNDDDWITGPEPDQQQGAITIDRDPVATFQDEDASSSTMPHAHNAHRTGPSWLIYEDDSTTRQIGVPSVSPVAIARSVAAAKHRKEKKVSFNWSHRCTHTHCRREREYPDGCVWSNCCQEGAATFCQSHDTQCDIRNPGVYWDENPSRAKCSPPMWPPKIPPPRPERPLWPPMQDVPHKRPAFQQDEGDWRAQVSDGRHIGPIPWKAKPKWAVEAEAAAGKAGCVPVYAAAQPKPKGPPAKAKGVPDVLLPHSSTEVVKAPPAEVVPPPPKAFAPALRSGLHELAPEVSGKELEGKLLSQGAVTSLAQLPQKLGTSKLLAHVHALSSFVLRKHIVVRTT
jgi:hypothetical protein